MELPKNHISLTSTKDMLDISIPLKMLNVDFFSYTRFYFDGTTISLLTHTDWYQFFLKQEVPGCLNVFNLEDGCNLWLDLFPENAVFDAKEHFSIDNGIHFSKRENNYVEAISYATNAKDLKAIGRFVSNIDLLENFIIYFKKRASTLIKKACQDRIVIPEIMKGYQTVKPELKLGLTDRKIFLKKIGYDNLVTKLSVREYECLQHVAQGKTVKEVANYLMISPRTVETYVNTMKRKLCCSTKSQLLNMFWETQVSYF